MTKEKKGQTINHLKHTTQKTKDPATRTPLKSGGELRCFGRVNSSCSTSGTQCVTLATNPVISHKWGKDRIAMKYAHIFIIKSLFDFYICRHSIYTGIVLLSIPICVICRVMVFNATVNNISVISFNLCDTLLYYKANYYC